MASDWKEFAIEEFADVVGGGTPSTSDEQNFGGDIPWITPKDLSNHKFRHIEHGERNITKKGLNDSNAMLLPAGTILLSTRAPVGYLAIAKNPVTTNQGFKNLVVHDGFDNEFIYYLLKANVDYLKSQASGTTFGELSGGTLKKLKFLLPPLPEQRAIAEVLGALDDTIELNRRMNRTLEALAKAVFRQWFVESEEVASWNVGKLSEICTTQYGFTASASDEPVGPKFLRITDMNKEPWIVWADVPYCEISEREFEKYRLSLGDILVSRIADPGKAGIVEEEVNAVFASYLVRLKFKDLAWSYFAYYFLRSEQYLEYANGAKSGSVQSGMNARVITDVNLSIPPDEKVVAFLETIIPLRNKVVANLKQSRTLAALRDALLPKLMRGEVRVRP